MVAGCGFFFYSFCFIRTLRFLGGRPLDNGTRMDYRDCVRRSDVDCYLVSIPDHELLFSVL